MHLRPTQIVVLAASAVIFVFSFFNFWSFDGIDGTSQEQIEAACDSDYGDLLSGDEKAQYDAACSVLGDGGVNAWNMDFYFPLSTWPALIALGVGVVAAIAIFTQAKLPDQVLGFTIPQALFGLSVGGALIMIGFLISGNEEGAGWGIGFWLMLLGSIALAVATAMEAQIQPTPTAAGPNIAPPPPGAPPAPPAPPAPGSSF